MKNLFSFSIFSYQKKFLLFIFVGLINTIFGFSCYSFFIYFGFGIYISTLISHCTGILFNFFTYGKFVFNSSLTIKKGYLFLINYVILYIINILLNIFYFQFLNNYYYSGLLSILSVTIFNFLFLKKIFK